MTDIDDKKFAIPCPNPQMVEAAIRTAKQMLVQTMQRLQAGPANIPEDDRLWTRLHRSYMDVFKVQTGLQSAAQIQEIKGNFGYLAQAANSIKTLCVSDAHPFVSSQRGQLGHEAFAYPGNSSTPTIYFAPAFFRLQARSQARDVVHELAHARLGVKHSGGEFLSFVTNDPCEASPLKTFDEAIDNAYVYDRFADCVSSAR
jgi:hypothetical protein